MWNRVPSSMQIQVLQDPVQETMLVLLPEVLFQVPMRTARYIRSQGGMPVL